MAKKKRKYISASQIECFLSCPLAYKYIYVDGAIRGPGNIYMSYGTAIHEALAENFKQKIKSRKDLDIKDVIKVFRKKIIDEANVLGTVNWDLVKNLTLQGEEMISQYMEQIAPKYQPVMVEEKFEIELKSYPGVIIMGFIDLVTECGLIIDHKTAGVTTRQKWTQKFVDELIQGTMYSIAYRKIFDKAEKAFRIDVLKRLKDGPKFKSIDSERSDMQLLQLIELMARMNEMVEKDIWFPNLKNCSTCDFKNTCNKLSYTGLK